MKTFSLLIALCAVGTVQAEAPKRLELGPLLLRVRDHNPDVLAARQAWHVKRMEVRPTGTWENPTLTYIDEKEASGLDGVDPQPMKRYRVEQAIPFPGKLTNASWMKQHEARIAESSYRAVILQVFKETRMRYYQLYLTDRQIELSDESVNILKNALRSAQNRLASAKSSALDVFLVQSELEKAQNSQFQFQQQRRQIELELNALLDQDLQTPLGLAGPPSLVDLELTLEHYQTLARYNDPTYLSATHELNHARATRLHHRLQFAPDFGVMYEKQVAPQGADGRMIGVSVSVPLWLHRPWKELQGAKEHVAEAEAKSRSMQNTVAKMVASEFLEVNTHLTMARRYVSGILPSVRSGLNIAQRRYGSGQEDFLTLLEAYRAWVSANTEYQEQLYQYGEHWSLLEQWVGLDLNQARAMFDQMKWMTPGGTHE